MVDAWKVYVKALRLRRESGRVSALRLGQGYVTCAVGAHL